MRDPGPERGAMLRHETPDVMKFLKLVDATQIVLGSKP
jgi:hypothetical protein